MTINATNLAKKYNSDWIFRQLNYTFSTGNKYAILGNNGSGKSTLLRIVGGMQRASEGDIIVTDHQGKCILADQYYQSIAYTAPSMQIIEEMTLSEFLNFHKNLKGFLPQFPLVEILRMAALDAHTHKKIQAFSSGMKQKVKLIQAFGSNASIVLLDEPCSNLDKDGINFYHYCLDRYSNNRIILIASNDEVEYPNVSNKLYMNDYQQATINRSAID